jgi:hypothetical protein
MAKITLIFDDNDVGQILDGLTERMADWQYTAECMDGGPIDPDKNFLECTDAKEARGIAEHYQRMVREIVGQCERQRGESHG